MERPLRNVMEFSAIRISRRQKTSLGLHDLTRLALDSKTHQNGLFDVVCLSACQSALGPC